MPLLWKNDGKTTECIEVLSKYPDKQATENTLPSFAFYLMRQSGSYWAYMSWFNLLCVLAVP